MADQLSYPLEPIVEVKFLSSIHGQKKSPFASPKYFLIVNPKFFSFCSSLGDNV